MGLTTMKVGCVSGFWKSFGAMTLFRGGGVEAFLRVIGVVERVDFDALQLERGS